jgi:competence protein ComEC
LGDENGIAPEIGDAFSRVGASHVIAISGFNMVILSGVIMNLLKRFHVPLRWAAGISIVVILIYTLFVGANAAVVRAAVMSSLLVIGEAIKRKSYVPASLALVAVIMSLNSPPVLWDVSFQLSFFATLGLALFVDPLAARFEWLIERLLPRSLGRSLSALLTEPLIVTLAVQITTLPLIVLYFNRLSLMTILTNLLIVPVQAGLLLIGIVATITAFIAPPLAQILYWYDLILLSWTTEAVRALADLPFAEVEFAVDPRLITGYFGLLIGGALMHATQPGWALWLARFVRHRAMSNATAAAGFGMVILLGASFFSRPDGLLHVWFLDVGHSNAVLVQTPAGAHMLIDGGAFPSRLLTALGDRLPFNDREIETLVITQPDANDYGALSAVVNRYDVGVVLTNGQQNLSPEFVGLQAQLSAHDLVRVQAGYTLNVADGARLEVLHPQAEPEINNSLDDEALVLRLQYGDVSFLLTGDISLSGQQTLLEASQWPLATVMQLPQHGGIRSLSEAFLAAAQPQAIVIQVDAANTRGDPDADVLMLLDAASIYRTDESGTLHLWTDGSRLWFQPQY